MKYRKKPVTVDAVRYTGDNLADVEEFLGREAKAEEATLPGPGRGLHDGIRIRTLEGTMTASVGDWVVKGTRGEFYPVKPGPFADTFEPAPQGDDEHEPNPTVADRLWQLAHALGESKTRGGAPAMGWDGLLEKAAALQGWFDAHNRAKDAAEDVERAGRRTAIGEPEVHVHVAPEADLDDLARATTAQIRLAERQQRRA